MMGWEEVLKKVVNQPLRVDKSAKKFVEGAKLKSLDVSKINPILEIGTDELASYHPTTSLGEIIYDVGKIAYHSDEVLSHAREDLGFPPPPHELILLFRWAFSHVVRRHEMFHYLVERGCKTLAEGHYKDYKVRVYEKRRNLGQGNLEEALADAYAIIRCLEDLQKMPQPEGLPYTKEELIPFFESMLKINFISNKRPPGYREAKHFLDEFTMLCLNDLITTLIKISIHNEPPWEAFKGISWLFYERARARAN